MFVKIWSAFKSGLPPGSPQDELNCLIWLLDAMLFKTLSKSEEDSASKTTTQARFVAMEIAISMSRHTSVSSELGVPLPLIKTFSSGTLGKPA